MLVSRKQLISEIARFGIAQCSKLLPFELEQTLQDINKEMAATPKFKKADKSNHGYAEFDDCYNLNKYLSHVLLMVPRFEKWNLTPHEYKKGVDPNSEERPKFSFTDSYTKVDAEHDFIDLDALIRNVANTCEAEHRSIVNETPVLG